MFELYQTSSRVILVLQLFTLPQHARPVNIYIMIKGRSCVHPCSPSTGARTAAENCAAFRHWVLQTPKFH